MRCQNLLKTQGANIKAAAMQTMETTPVVRRTCQSSGYIFIRLSFAKGVSGRTPKFSSGRPSKAGMPRNQRNRAAVCCNGWFGVLTSAIASYGNILPPVSRNSNPSHRMYALCHIESEDEFLERQGCANKGMSI